VLLESDADDIVHRLGQASTDVDVRAMPLTDVEQAWTDASTTTQRIVLIPRA
jgi:hypothetical protein